MRDKVFGAILGSVVYTFGLIVAHPFLIEPYGVTSYPMVYIVGMVCWWVAFVVIALLWILAGYTAGDV